MYFLRTLFQILFAMIHDLKILPQYFRAVLERRKTFEVRKKDRLFTVGDGVCLKEFDPECENKYTGRVWYGFITYILDDPLYCKEGYIIMSIVEEY